MVLCVQGATCFIKIGLKEEKGREEIEIQWLCKGG